MQLLICCPGKKDNPPPYDFLSLLIHSYDQVPKLQFEDTPPPLLWISVYNNARKRERKDPVVDTPSKICFVPTIHHYIYHTETFQSCESSYEMALLPIYQKENNDERGSIPLVNSQSSQDHRWQKFFTMLVHGSSLSRTSIILVAHLWSVLAGRRWRVTGCAW